jgi:hypothetical protein
VIFAVAAALRIVTTGLSAAANKRRGINQTPVPAMTLEAMK